MQSFIVFEINFMITPFWPDLMASYEFRRLTHIQLNLIKSKHRCLNFFAIIS
jgi:hypothetical protein